MYVFSFTFGGLIRLDESDPNYDSMMNSFYGQNQFWKINFNDFTGAFITLFCLIHISDFDVIASGFVSVTNSYARIYFALWYLIGVVLILNVIKSFFLSDLIIWVNSDNTPVEKKISEEDVLTQSIKMKISERISLASDMSNQNLMVQDRKYHVSTSTLKVYTTQQLLLVLLLLSLLLLIIFYYYYLLLLLLLYYYYCYRYYYYFHYFFLIIIICYTS